MASMKHIIHSMEDTKMKKWNAAEIVELNIAETANGKWNSVIEFSHNGKGWNNSLVDGNNPETPETPETPVDPEEGKGETPDTLS